MNGFVNVVITTIEKRFGLNSFQTGLIAGGYDIASFLCLVPVTYLGGRVHASKPKWVGVGVLVMGLGALVFSLPHFLSGPYKVSTVNPNICKRIGNISDFQVRFEILPLVVVCNLVWYNIRWIVIEKPTVNMMVNCLKIPRCGYSFLGRFFMGLVPLHSSL